MSEKSYRTAQPSTLAAFLPWGSLKGAGRMTLTHDKGKFLIKIEPPEYRKSLFGTDPKAYSLADQQSMQRVRS
jgi:hypothetical protein